MNFENDDDGGTFDAQAQMTRGSGGGGGLDFLFGLNKKMDNPSATNTSLQYKAPIKPPKPDGRGAAQQTEEKQSGKKTQKSPPSVVVAVAVNAFKLVNGQYASQGKLGAALLASHDLKDYKIFMYVTKQQPVTTATIKENFIFNILDDNNYVTFNDDLQQSWSISFDSKEKLMEYAKQISICKFLCSERDVVLQDLFCGETSQKLSSGDSVEVKYTGWLFSENKLGKVFDTNNNSDKTFRFKIGKGKVIKGWEIGMVGMMKKGKRFIIIPPSFAYGKKSVGDRVPANSTLAFEVDVLRIKYVNEVKPAPVETTTISADDSKNEITPQIRQSEESTSEMTVKDRAASLDEQTSSVGNSEDQKSKLLSRMARMGHAMLPQQPVAQPTHDAPVQQASAQQASIQTSTPRQSPAPALVHPHTVSISPSPVQYMNTSSLEVAQMYGAPLVHQQPSTVMLQNQIPASYNPQQTFPSPVPAAYASDFAAILLNETRQQSNEIKDIQSKLDKVVDKVDEVKEISSRSNSAQTPSYAMDANMISHSIQRILTENQTLKSQVESKDKHIEHQNDKISNLMEQNQRYMEKSHKILEDNHDNFKQTLGKNEAANQQHEQEKIELQNKIRGAVEEVTDLRSAVKEMKEAEKELRKKLHRAEDDLKTKQTTTRENQDLLDQIATHVGKADKVTKELEDQQLSWKKEKADLLANIQHMKQENEKVLNEVDKMKIKVTESEEGNVGVKRKLANAEKEYNELETIKNDEIHQLCSKLEILQKKFLQLREMYMKTKEGGEELKSQAKEAQVYQQKYDRLREQSLAMKHKYEARIRELMEQKKNEEDGNASDDVDIKVKTVMNVMFTELRDKVDKEAEYNGTQVLAIVLSVIKSSAKKMLEERQDEVEEETSHDDSNQDETAKEEATESSHEDKTEPEVVQVSENDEEESSKQDEQSENVAASPDEDKPDVTNKDEVTMTTTVEEKVVEERDSGYATSPQEERSLSGGTGSPVFIDDSAQPPPLDDNVDSDNVDSEDDDWLK